MRSYGQFCGVARGLDQVGDRWSLLVIRELLIQDCRWADLKAGLPGIASNLLAERLRALETAGVLSREQTSSGQAVYRLTDRGRGLAPVLRELAKWSLPLMLEGRSGDAARGHWLVLAVDALYDGADLRGLAPLRIVAETEGTVLTVDVMAPNRIEARLGDGRFEDVRLRGPAEAVVAALTGAGTDGLVEVVGDASTLDRLAGRLSAPGSDLPVEPGSGHHAAMPLSSATGGVRAAGREDEQ